MKRFGLITLFCLMVLTPDSRDTLGDVNNDGEVNVQDIVLIVDIILTDGIEYGDYELWASDVNVDETTDVIDIVIIVDWILNPPEITECLDNYSPCLDDTTQCCLDITNHEFEWNYELIGTYGSRLYDVSIISPNNIWAVGIIETDSISYNAVHWDGESWEYFRMLFTHPLGADSAYGYIKSIHAFSASDIWMSVYWGSDIHYNGVEWVSLDSSGCGSNFIWGLDSCDFYKIGGQFGNICNYNCEGFSPMETPGYDITLREIHGNADIKFSVGNDFGGSHAGESVALVLLDSIWYTFYHAENYLPNDENLGMVYTAHVIEDTCYLPTRAGLWKYNYITEQSIILSAENYNMVERRPVRMVSNSRNDIMIITAWFEMVHFNGESWYVDDEIYQNFGPYQISAAGVDLLGNDIIIVGYVSSFAHAIIARGHRSQ